MMSAMRSEPFSFLHAGDRLVGDLLLPAGEGPFPALVMVHGDGPAPRDGWGYAPPFWRACTAAGIACVAWDKPGVGASGGDWLARPLAMRGAEVAAAIHALAADRRIRADRIACWGMSQAAYIMPHTDPCCTVAVAWPHGSLEDLGHRLISTHLAAAGCSADEVAAGLALNHDLHDILRTAADPQPALIGRWATATGRWADILRGIYGAPDPRRTAWARSAVHVRAADGFARLRGPLLAMYGARDLLVDADAGIAALRAAIPADRLTVRVVPEADHALFRSTTGTLDELMRQAADPAANLAPEVVPTITDWLVKHLDP
jgi:pimeloyl-ACP methyl ester carboxylesterase